LDWWHINDTSKEVTIPFYSEYKCNDQLFRSHPNYWSEGPWYDWV